MPTGLRSRITRGGSTVRLLQSGLTNKPNKPAHRNIPKMKRLHSAINLSARDYLLYLINETKISQDIDCNMLT
jgi:hypothetical protein